MSFNYVNKTIHATLPSPRELFLLCGHFDTFEFPTEDVQERVLQVGVVNEELCNFMEAHLKQAPNLALYISFLHFLVYINNIEYPQLRSFDLLNGPGALEDTSKIPTNIMHENCMTLLQDIYQYLHQNKPTNPIRLYKPILNFMGKYYFKFSAAAQMLLFETNNFVTEIQKLPLFNRSIARPPFYKSLNVVTKKWGSYNDEKLALRAIQIYLNKLQPEFAKQFIQCLVNRVPFVSAAKRMMYHHVVVNYLLHSNREFVTQLIEDLTDLLIHKRDALLDEAVDAYTKIVDDYSSIQITIQKNRASREGSMTGLRSRFRHATTRKASGSQETSSNRNKLPHFKLKYA